MAKEISGLITGGQNPIEMLRRSLERIIQLYTDKSHFVYELLQNAEDTGATGIKFIQYKDHLEVYHDGHGFTISNLKGLCDVGQSDKINNLNQIGEFGVGFKSVFGICEVVRLYSSPRKEDQSEECYPFAVQINDFVTPKDIDYYEVEKPYTTKFYFPYKVGETFSGFKTIDALNKAITIRLKNLGVSTLLFMRNLESIEYEVKIPGEECSGRYLLNKEIVNDHCSYVYAVSEENNDDKEISYLKFTDKLNGNESIRTIDIAYPVTKNEDGTYTFKKPKNPYISVYFPTETESKLNFIVQGPFRTTPNRSSVPADDEENIKLVKQVTTLFEHSVLELRDMGYLNLSFLSLLPMNEDDFNAYGLFYPVYEKTLSIFKKHKMIPCKEGGYCSAETALLARGRDLPDLFSDKDISYLINSKINYHWLPTTITETGQYRLIHNYFINDLDVEELRPEDLRQYFNANKTFLVSRDNDWLARFYKMYEAIPNVFSESNTKNILNAQIVKTNTNEFVAPYRKVEKSWVPNVFLPSSKVNSDEIMTVNSEMFKRCPTFFKNTLHLNPPDEYEFFIKDLKNRYLSGKNVDDEIHCNDVRKLAYFKRSSDYPEEVAKAMKENIWLVCTRDGKAVRCKTGSARVLFPKTKTGLDIMAYYENVSKTVTFVNLDYYSSHGVNYDELAEYDIQDNIIINDDITSGEYITDSHGRGRAPTWTAFQGFKWKLTLDKLEEVLVYICAHPRSEDSKKKSSIIFQTLKEQEKHLVGTVFITGSVGHKYDEPAAIIKTLLNNEKKTYGPLKGWNGKWVFTKNNVLASTKEISKHDLDTAIYGALDPASELYEILQFKKGAVDLREKDINDYDDIPDEQKDVFFEIALQRKYGITVEQLEHLTAGGRENGGGEADAKQYEPFFEFPSSSVKNWDALKKHAAQVLYYADPVNYAPKVRQIRISKSAEDVQAYLKSTYRVDGDSRFACQLCHKPFSSVEMCQLEKSPDVELDPLYVCLCNNCASTFREFRNNDTLANNLIESLCGLTDTDINNCDPVKIKLGKQELWFTQTHAAEIRELFALKEKANNIKNEPEVIIAEETDLKAYDGYKGKKIFVKAGAGGAKVSAMVEDVTYEKDKVYLVIRFLEGLKKDQTTKYDLMISIEKNTIELA